MIRMQRNERDYPTLHLDLDIKFSAHDAFLE